MQQRRLSIISEYVTEIHHIRGAENIVADALSRPVSALQLEHPDLASIAKAQTEDPEVQKCKDALTSHQLSADLTILCETSSIYPRPYVPLAQRESVFRHLHNLAHPGIRGSTNLIAARYYWPKMKGDIKQWVNNCLECQKAKVNRHSKNIPEQPIYPFNDRFQTVHMDIVGPLKPSKTLGAHYTSEMLYVVTLIDRATRWFECVPVASITATIVAEAFLTHWISRFGVPLCLTTDQGRQFESSLFSALSHSIGFHRLRTTAYHPQSNGMIERFHRTLKTALMTRNEEWLVALPVVCLALRALPNEHGYSPFTAMTGSDILMPHVFFHKANPSTKEQIEAIQQLNKHMRQLDFTTLSEGIHHGRTIRPQSVTLQPGQYVWLRIDRVRQPLEAPYQGPYKVLDTKQNIVKIELPDGSTSCVSLDRVKLAKLPMPMMTPGTTTATRPVDQKAHAPIASSPHNPPEPPRTRSGRCVRFNQHRDCIYY